MSGTDQTLAARLWLVSACAFCSMASMRVADSMLPALAATFDATAARAAQTISAYALAYGVLQLVYGPLGDRFGKVRVIALATLACTVGSVCAALAPTLDWLIVSRAVTGAFAAGIIPLSMAWIGDAVAFQQRQPVLAKLLGATVFGMICGQWADGLLAEGLGWRAAFFLLGAVFVVCGSSLLRQELRTQAQASAPPSKALAFRQILTAPWPQAVLLLAALEGAFAFSALAFIPFHLHHRFGLSLTLAGGLVAMFGIGGLLYSAVSRRLIQTLDQAGLAALGGGLACAAFALIAVANAWWLALIACLGAGCGFYTLHNVLQVNATQMAPQARGTAVSLFASFLFLGQSLGISAAAWTVDHLTTTLVFAAASVGLLAVGLAFAGLLRRRARSGANA